MNIKTKFAPAERASKEEIFKDYNDFISNDYLKNILNSLPYIVAILNPKRQIIFSNNVLIDSLDYKSIEDIFGLRVGEVIRCTHSHEEEYGCGTSESCRYCGAVQTIIESQKKKIKVARECRITSKVNGKELSYDFLVTANPFKWNNNYYTILSLNDISHSKRRLTLEHIFFHDVINKVGSLNGFLELINEIDDPVQIKEFVKNAIEISNDLTEDIVSQRELLAAESDELIVHKTNLLTADIINTVVNVIIHHDVARDKIISIDPKAANVTLNTDFSIIKRVLINLLKNALEATEPNGKVSIGCDIEENSIIFWVHNSSYVPREIELQIFQRSFSTKGINRGLGSYSIKLLTEKYLGGKVYFKTDKIKGTTFFINLPV